MTERRPIQYAAGTLAASAFVAVTQILAGATLDTPLYLALTAFALNIPFQIIIFFMPIVVPSEPLMSWPQILYWGVHRYSTFVIILGFVALFWHFAWWLAVFFSVAAFSAYQIYRFCAFAPDYDSSSRASEQPPTV